MKKILALLLVLSMIFTLGACASKAATSAAASAASTPAASTAASASASASAAASASTAASSSAAAADLTGDLHVSVQSWMLNKYDFASMESDFEANHPGVDVHIDQVEDSEITSYMLQWSQGSTDCALVVGNSREMIVPLCAAGYVTELDDSFFSDISKDDFYPAFLQLGNIDGKQFMIPFCCEVVGISCNMQIFKEAGLLDADGNLPQPKSWDELSEMAKKISALGYTGLSIDWGTNMMEYSYATTLQGIAGSIYESDGTTLDFTSDSAKETMNTWKGLVDGGLSPTDTFADANAGRTNFKAGTVGMLLAPASRWIECQTELGKGNVGLMLVPGTDTNGTCAFIHGAYVCSLATPTEQELAKLFIKEELLREDILVAAMNNFGKMSPLTAHYTKDNLDDPYWDTCLKATETSFCMPLYKDFNKLNTSMISEMQSCLVGEISVDDCLGSLSDTIHNMDLSSGLGG